ncbi:hypothetical protein EJK51_1037 [Moraxella catarrhalis]|nr:hypothetical protein EJK52_1039 [Moraxella catarrhalis]AZQ91402.1 hypothetical protein EJK51_1037 [Moraxella catarrhalis]
MLPAPKPNNFIKLFGFFIALKMINLPNRLSDDRWFFIAQINTPLWAFYCLKMA